MELSPGEEWLLMFILLYSKRQTVISRSSTEAELYAMNKVAVDTERIRSMLQFINGWNIPYFTLFVDNQSAITMAKQESGSRKQSRSFRLRRDDMKQMIDDGYLVVKYISGMENPADGTTKIQSVSMFQKFAKFLYQFG